MCGEKCGGKEVTFYDGGCLNCQKVASFLSANGIDYVRKNVKAHPELMGELGAKAVKTLPAIDIDGKIITGWDEQALRKALCL